MPAIRFTSDEFIVRAFHRYALEGTLAILAAAMVYVCLVPFDLRPSFSLSSGPDWHWGLRVRPFNMADIIANITMYLPLGALCAAVWRKRGRGTILSWLLAVLGCGLLSLGIEYAQHFVASRVESWVDVVANVTGAALGAMLYLACERGIIRTLIDASGEARVNWRPLACRMFIAAVLVIQLRPMDVVVDVPRTAAKAWRTADFHPLGQWHQADARLAAAVAARNSDAIYDLRRWRWEYALDRVVDVLVYAAAAAMLIVGSPAGRQHRWQLCLRAGVVTCGLAGGITFIRIFLMSWGFDPAYFYCGLVAWPLGCVAGSLVTSREKGIAAEKSAHRFTSDSGRMTVLAAFCLAIVTLYELVPFDFSSEAALSRSRVCLFPFKAHFAGRTNVAVNDILGDLLRYALAAASVSILLARIFRDRWRVNLAVTTLFSALAAAVFETIHVWMPSRQADVTTILLATLAASVAVVALRWLEDLRASLLIVEANDLLTSQLIEGETYKPIVVRPGARPLVGASPRGPAESDQQD